MGPVQQETHVASVMLPQKNYEVSPLRSGPGTMMKGPAGPER